MIDKKFCEYVEYAISKAFSNSLDKEIKNQWCDGILLPFDENEYSSKTINDRRQLELTAFIGYGGQEKYKLTIYFGNKSLSRNARNLDLKECIPTMDNYDWILIDKDKKEIEVKLK